MQNNKNIPIQIKLLSVAFFGIIVQTIATQGILTYNIFNFLGVWEIKKYLYPIGLLIVLFAFFFKTVSRIKLSIITIILFLYFLIQYLYTIFNHIPIVSLLYSIREVVILFLMVVIYSNLDFPKSYLDKLSKLLLILTILNIAFIGLTFFLGAEAYMKLMTGRYFWPKDPLLKFKISTFMNLTWRSPGLIGESAAVGLFGLFSFFFILHSKYKKYYWLPIILIFLSFTRSVYVVIVVYYFFKIISIKKYFKYAMFSFPIIIMAIIFLFRLGLLSLTSLQMRINNWVNKVNLDSHILFGGNLVNIGTAAPEDSGFANTMDSYWLFLYHGLGIFGIILIILFLLKKIALTKDNLFFLIGVFVAGLFITFTQSIPFLVFFPLLSISNWWKNEE